jgi:hypothetical protein
VVALLACGTASPPAASTTPVSASARTVAFNPADFPGLKACPESGSGDHYLAAEQSGNPDQYAADKPEIDGWKSAGATEIYVAVFANAAAGCGVTSPHTPDGQLAQALVIHFGAESQATASFQSRIAAYQQGGRRGPQCRDAQGFRGWTG